MITGSQSLYLHGLTGLNGNTGHGIIVDETVVSIGEDIELTELDGAELVLAFSIHTIYSDTFNILRGHQIPLVTIVETRLHGPVLVDLSSHIEAEQELVLIPFRTTSNLILPVTSTILCGSMSIAIT